jgi:hypothetical protein
MMMYEFLIRKRLCRRLFLKNFPFCELQMRLSGLYGNPYRLLLSVPSLHTFSEKFILPFFFSKQYIKLIWISYQHINPYFRLESFYVSTFFLFLFSSKWKLFFTSAYFVYILLLVLLLLSVGTHL